jgi:DnaJ domain
LEHFENWRYYSSGRIAFQIALIGFILIVTILMTVKPPWSEQVTVVVSKYVWFRTPLLSDAYDALVIASGVCAAIIPVVWFVAYQRLNSDLPGVGQFLETWAFDTPGASDSDFVGSYWTTDEQPPEYEEHDSADAKPEWDGHSDQQSSCYAVLGIDPTASTDEIKAAYRDKIKQYHPDRVASLGPKLQELAERKTKALNAAYEEALSRV